MANRILISGLVVAADAAGNEVQDANVLKSLGGLTAEGLASEYFEDSLEDLDIQGGETRLVFNEATQRLNVQTEYLSAEMLSEEILNELVDYTQGQWSDGIGEGGFESECELDLSFDCLPIDDNYTLEVQQAQTSKALKKIAAIVRVAESGSVAELQKCIENGEDIESENKYGFNCLEVAIQQNNVDVAIALLEAGANIHPRKKDETSALHSACEKENLDVVRRLVERGADLECRDEQNWTGLMWAVVRSNIEIAELLLEKGADANAKCTSRTVLDYVREGANLVGFIELLIKHGADPNVTSRFGANAYEVAVFDDKLKKAEALFPYVNHG